MKSLHDLSDVLQSKSQYFELMRTLERASSLMSTRPAGHDSRVLPQFVRLLQPSLMSFAAAEVHDVSLSSPSAGASQVSELVIRQRGFGLFAPYGPLPLHITEHAFNEKLFHKSAAFESFIGLLIERLTWMYYCSWSAMHPALGWERSRNSFRERLDSLSRSDKRSAAVSRHAHGTAALVCRQSHPGLYFAGARSLQRLRWILQHYFRQSVQVFPRHKKWWPAPEVNRSKNRIGSWRLGSRMLDAQQHIAIEVGPVKASEYALWRRNGDALKSLISLVTDYTEGRVSVVVDVCVVASSDMGARVGGWRLGLGGWLSADDTAYRNRVFESNLEI
jgi:type VI secretion system protein ImpH